MRKIEDIVHQAGGNLWNVEPFAPGMVSGLVHLPDCGTCTVVIGWNEDCKWNHVSVSPIKKMRIPTWNDMCKLKDWCFYPEEEAYEIHPKHSDYINLVQNCLHLWQPITCALPTGYTLEDLCTATHIENRGENGNQSSGA